MRIVEVLFTLESGGAERFVVDLSNELSKTNDVTLLTLKDDRKDSDKRNFYKFDLSDRVKYVNVGLSDRFRMNTLWNVYKAIKDLKPDVVHLNAKTSFQFCALAILLLSSKVKFVETIHNDLHNGYTTLPNKFMFNVFGRFKRMTYVALSATNYNEMAHYYPYCKFELIVNGRSELKPTKLLKAVGKEVDSYKKNKDTKVFLHIARCNSQKNQGLLIDSFNEFQRGNGNAILLIIGAGFDSQEGRILKEKAGENIHFLGTRTNVSDYMFCSDIFCLSSLFEGMPITLIEASLAGVPCVSTPVCGSVDIIQNGVNGVLSKGFTVGEYVEALKVATSNFSELKKNAELLKENNPYTMELCAKKYIQVFKN